MNLSIILIVLCAHSFLTLIGFIILYNKISKNDKAEENELKIVYFDEIHVDEGLIKKKYSMKIKQQLYYRGYPIGQPFVVLENKIETVDREQVDKYLKEYLGPVADLGKAYVEIKSGQFFKSK